MAFNTNDTPEEITSKLSFEESIEFTRAAVVSSQIWLFVVSPIQSMLKYCLPPFHSSSEGLLASGLLEPSSLSHNYWLSGDDLVCFLWRKKGHHSGNPSVSVYCYQFLPASTLSRCLICKGINLSKAFCKSLRLGPFIPHLEHTIDATFSCVHIILPHPSLAWKKFSSSPS